MGCPGAAQLPIAMSSLEIVALLPCCFLPALHPAPVPRCLLPPCFLRLKSSFIQLDFLQRNNTCVLIVCLLARSTDHRRSRVGDRKMAAHQ